MVSSRYLITFLLAVTAAFLSLLILNRWSLIGSSPECSTWQVFINYFEFGFVRRAFVGTLLALSGLPDLFDDQYAFSRFIQGVSILILTFLILLHVLKNDENIENLLKVVVFLSPAFIIQSGFISGAHDIFVLLVATAAILFVKNPYLFSLLSVIGTLIHELYVFTVPAQVFAFYWRNGPNELNVKEFIKMLWLPMLGLSVALILIFLFGKSDLSKTEYIEKLMRETPDLIYKKRHLGGYGYFEISSSLEQNIALARSYSKLVENFWFLLFPLICLAALCVVLVRNAGTLWLRIAFCTSALFPLLVSLIATDPYRWIGMSANMSILLILLIATERRIHMSKWNYLSLLPFTALVPFGSNLTDRPFPMHQYVIERFLM